MLERGETNNMTELVFDGYWPACVGGACGVHVPDEEDLIIAPGRDEPHWEGDTYVGHPLHRPPPAIGSKRASPQATPEGDLRPHYMRCKCGASRSGCTGLRRTSDYQHVSRFSISDWPLDRSKIPGSPLDLSDWTGDATRFQRLQTLGPLPPTLPDDTWMHDGGDA
jgi:hypothetical protein